MKTLAILLLLITAVLIGYTQNVVRPGDKIIHYDLIKSSHDFYKNIITDTLGNIQYEFMMEDLTTVDATNKRITFARSRQVPIGSFSTDTSITDLSFKPIRMHEIHEQRKVSYDMLFADEKATVKTMRNDELSVKEYPMKKGYFEDNMIEYIFGYLDLKKGVTYILDNFNKDTTTPSDPYTLEYSFDDVWTFAAGYKLNCSIIHFIHGNTTGYIWIDKSTHQMIKEEGNFKTGSFMLTKI